MLTIYQRLVLGYVLLLALLVGAGINSARSLDRAAALDRQTAHSPVQAAEIRGRLAQQARTRMFAGAFLGLLVSAGFLIAVIRPLHRVAMTARRIGAGELEQRVDWYSRGDLGIIAAEINRMAVQLRDLRDTESGRKELAHQLSDAVVQSIFEPVIVTDAKGQVLKLNRAARDILGDAAGDRMALTNTPGGEKILTGGSRGVIDAALDRQRRRSGDPADEDRPGGAHLSSAHHAHARPRRQAAGGGQRA